MIHGSGRQVSKWPERCEFQCSALDDPVGLLTSLAPMISKLVSGFLFRRRDARWLKETDDLCQDVFLHLIKDDFRCLRAYDSNRGSPKTWLALIVKRKLQEIIRRSRCCHLALFISPTSLPSHPMESPLQNLLNREDELLLRKSIMTLDGRDRIFWALLDFCDYDTAITATVTNLTPRRVSQRKSRLASKLRAKLTDFRAGPYHQ